MAPASKKAITRSIAIASRSCAIFVVGLIFLSSFRDYSLVMDDEAAVRGGHHLISRRPPCDEIYVVGEGETLHTISDKCGDPFIVEQNPHINDPDDVYPGLVIKITPFSNSRG
ncbi:uncharacterized protein LOC132279632 [Cornus florida]|uniref:uncharacterized protein LOC132279632 n=1 Tax=Cornus florida TaxID=4283 RepID=UPI0028A02482|nr:uncharacterized protein LOC132279632 [Cornus florida]